MDGGHINFTTFDESGKINFKTYNGTILFDQSGKVGIGTTVPQATLDVARGTAPHGAAVFRGTSADRSSHFNYSTDEHTYIRGGKTNAFVLLNDNGGNVGIGTNAPGKKLEVNGDILLRNSTGSKQIFTWADTDNNWRIGMSVNPGFTRSLVTSHVQFLTYGNAPNQGFAVGVNGGNSSFEVRGSDHMAYFRGKVGIGTNDPNKQLEIKSASASDLASMRLSQAL
ncbi:MAG: hypothetical protein HC896_19115 [Bacteroidales bacterium]|nr:hypothetical protein [Bacteroidales bacterium]